jgi:hypothetical protein
MLVSVFVVDENQIYACGTSGEILHGSVRGWAEIGDGGGALGPVVAYRGKVYLGSTSRGLLRLDGNKVTQVYSDIRPWGMDARGTLLIACQDEVVEVVDPDDPSSIRRFPLDAFTALTPSYEPLWW